MAGLGVEWLGRVPYAAALRLQEDAVCARRAGATGDRLLLLEHPPVVTLGRGAHPGSLRVSEAELRRRGVEVHRVGRGGDVTYHAPGQLVGYAIVDLAARGRPDAHRFLRDLEAALIRALARIGLGALRCPGRTGVFLDRRRKIASIGIGLRHWVTWHGFALNVDLDLAGFDAIVPCGLHDVQMTSVAAEIGARSGLRDLVREAVADAFRPGIGGASDCGGAV